MKFAVLLMFAGVAINCCLAAVPLDEPKKIAAFNDEVAEPEVVLAEPLSPALLAQVGSRPRLVRQAYDDVSVDVVSSNGGGGGGEYGGDYGGGYGGDYGNGGETEVDVNVSNF